MIQSSTKTAHQRDKERPEHPKISSACEHMLALAEAFNTLRPALPVPGAFFR